MFLTNKANFLFLAITFALASCSGSKSEQVLRTQVASQEQSEASSKSGSLSDITLMINANQLDAREAGIRVGEALQANQTNDLKNFNYEASIKNYSDISKALNIKFGEDSDKSLIFLAEAIGISTLDGYDKLDRTGKEKEILKRIGMIKENSYLELEFFLAHYFLNNKIFESLRAVSTDNDNESLTYCKGYLLDFVKNIYKKNSRYPDAFKKYAIWGEVLNECNFGPIFVPTIVQIQASYPKEVKAEQVILANILKSDELDNLKNINAKFTEKTPPIVKTLINHILFSAKALNNPSQIVFDLNSINNALVFLDRIVAKSSDADEISQLNFADHLRTDLYLKLRESLNNKSVLFNKTLASADTMKKMHPLLKAIAIEVTGQVNEGEPQKMLIQNSQENNFPFLRKWNLIKDSLLIKAYISALSKNGDSDILIPALKDKLEIILKECDSLHIESNENSSKDSLYQNIEAK